MCSDLGGGGISRSDREGFESAFLPSLRSFPLCQFSQVARGNIFLSIPRGRRPGRSLLARMTLASLEERPVACLHVV